MSEYSALIEACYKVPKHTGVKVKRSALGIWTFLQETVFKLDLDECMGF